MATNQNGEYQNSDMPKQRQAVNDVTVCASSQILYCGHSTQYSHLVLPVMSFTFNFVTQKLNKEDAIDHSKWRKLLKHTVYYTRTKCTGTKCKNYNVWPYSNR